MKTRSLASLALLGLLVPAVCGCHKTQAADSTAGNPTVAAPAKPGAGAANSGASIGLNPNYQGPANGGVGTKAPGGQ